MRGFAATCLTLACIAPAWGAEGNYCRAQLLLECAESCESTMAPADLALDFEAGSGDLCRGERCDSGRLEWRDETGQWDERSYRVFALAGENASASGVIDLDSRTFFAVTSDTATLFGRCE